MRAYFDRLFHAGRETDMECVVNPHGRETAASQYCDLCVYGRILRHD